MIKEMELVIMGCKNGHHINNKWANMYGFMLKKELVLPMLCPVCVEDLEVIWGE
jgi:hypothetical protein